MSLIVFLHIVPFNIWVLQIIFYLGDISGLNMCTFRLVMKMNEICVHSGLWWKWMYDCVTHWWEGEITWFRPKNTPRNALWYTSSIRSVGSWTRVSRSDILLWNPQQVSGNMFLYYYFVVWNRFWGGQGIVNVYDWKKTDLEGPRIEFDIPKNEINS